MRLAAILLALALTTTSAFAADASGTATITGGSLSVSTTAGSLTFSTTLNGTDASLTSSTAPTFRVVDARGTGAGWNVAFTCTNLSTGGATPKTLNVSNLTFQPASGTVTVIDGSSGAAAPTETGAAATALDATTGFKVLSAPVDGGMGTYDYTPLGSKFTLSVPAETYAGSYTCTLTATVSSGP